MAAFIAIRLVMSDQYVLAVFTLTLPLGYLYPLLALPTCFFSLSSTYLDNLRRLPSSTTSNCLSTLPLPFYCFGQSLVCLWNCPGGNQPICPPVLHLVLLHPYRVILAKQSKIFVNSSFLTPMMKRSMRSRSSQFRAPGTIPPARKLNFLSTAFQSAISQTRSSTSTR